MTGGATPEDPVRPFERLVERVESAGLRLPFTIATVAMLALARWLTGNVVGIELGTRTIARLGFSPADTASFDVVQAMMSAFVTNGPLAFWTAVAATSLVAGFSEWRFGSLRTAIAFWGTHLVTLALSWVLLAPLHLAGDTLGSLVFVARDVGPSAGYVGCLGYSLRAFGTRTQAFALALGVVVLAGLLAVGLRTFASSPTDVSASLSHLLALPVGYLLGLLTSRTPPPRRAGA